MDDSTSSSTQKETSLNKSDDMDDDSMWSDINSSDEETEGSLKIDLKDDDDAEAKSVTSKKKTGQTSSSMGPKKSSTPIPSGKMKAKTRPRKLYVKNRRGNLSKIEVPEEIVKDAQSFEQGMEKIAGRLRLNRTQVKSVIRSLVEAPELLSLVQEMAGDKPSASSTPSKTSQHEMRVTRTFAKNLTEGGGKLDWFLERVQQRAVTPEKANPDGDDPVPFIAADLPDEDDEEYDPGKDMAEMSDEESLMSNGTPTTLASPATDTPSSVTPTSKTKSNDFKRPADRPSAAKASSSSSSVVRSLDFEDESEAKLRLTRSRADMKAITIEELDTNFDPPDITADMYDNVIDDYTLFLAETFSQPVDKAATEEPAEAEEKDPDFVYQEQDELFDVIDEFTFNKTTKIPQKEADLLMKELFEAYDLDQSTSASPMPDKKHVSLNESSTTEGGKAVDQPADSSEAVDTSVVAARESTDDGEEALTDQQRLIIGQQMRQHIQLVAQMALLTSKSAELSILHTDCRTMLAELMTRSFQTRFSAFAQDNLFPSIRLVDEWDASPYSPTERSKKGRLELSPDLFEVVGNNSAFIYPHLLPTTGLIVTAPTSSGYPPEEKVHFSSSEDHLIALALDAYAYTKAKGRSMLVSCCNGLASNLMRSKTPRQIQMRIKNQKLRHRKNANPIGHFFANGSAIRLAASELSDYDSSKVVAPKFVDPSLLPSVWKTYFKLHSFEPSTPLNGSSKSDQQQAIETSTNCDDSSAKDSSGDIGDRIVVELTVPVSTTSAPTFTIIEATSSDPPSANKQQKRPPKRIAPNLPGEMPKAKVVSHGSILDVAMEECQISGDMPTLSLATPKKSDDNVAVESTPSPNKSTRKTKQQKETDVTLRMLEAEKPDEVAVRKEHEAMDIMLNARSSLSTDKLKEFYAVILDESMATTAKFSELHRIATGHMILQEMLIDILTAQDAMKLGLPVYDQFCVREAMKSFLRKVKVLHANQPSAFTRILRELNTVLNSPGVKLTEVKALGTKLFKGHRELIDEFFTFVPTVPYPEGMLPQPECVDLSEDEDEDDGAEHASLLDEDSAFGSENCPCQCHPSPNTTHCIHCSLTFINGKVYSKDGKVLKPVKIQFPEKTDDVHSKKNKRKPCIRQKQQKSKAT